MSHQPFLANGSPYLIQPSHILSNRTSPCLNTPYHISPYQTAPSHITPPPQGYLGNRSNGVSINGWRFLWHLWQRVLRLVGWLVPPSFNSKVWWQWVLWYSILLSQYWQMPLSRWYTHCLSGFHNSFGIRPYQGKRNPGKSSIWKYITKPYLTRPNITTPDSIPPHQSGPLLKIPCHKDYPCLI